ncbi:hypothetical protein M1843_18240 [Isoptericola sp. 4D.3]|uniref:Lipoprotein n=1 Tax=Isoptericola peretonis TaxID=2918523 RepID=A0ABT0J865_9MICO|nr:hypothetical protein [Isoptericola sp. 4D.3]
MNTRRLRVLRAPAVAALVAAAAVGCSGPGDDDARDVVSRFYAAVADGDGAAACALLLPGAADDLAEEEQAPCPEALLDPAGPGGVLGPRAADAAVEAVHRAGSQAQVVTASDTVFLARSGDTWVVTAVGCDPRGERPYDCEVES